MPTSENPAKERAVRGGGDDDDDGRTGEWFRKIAISTAKNKDQFRDKARSTRRKIKLARKTIPCEPNAQENGANDTPPLGLFCRRNEKLDERGARRWAGDRHQERSDKPGAETNRIPVVERKGSPETAPKCCPS